MVECARLGLHIYECAHLTLNIYIFVLYIWHVVIDIDKLLQTGKARLL